MAAAGLSHPVYPSSCSHPSTPRKALQWHAVRERPIYPILEKQKQNKRTKQNRIDTNWETKTAPAERKREETMHNLGVAHPPPSFSLPEIHPVLSFPSPSSLSSCPPSLPSALASSLPSQERIVTKLRLPKEGRNHFSCPGRLRSVSSPL